MANDTLGYALVGCGRFGRFCMTHYRTMPSIRLVAAADADASLAQATGAEFGVAPLTGLEEVLARPDVDIVHLATPPATHGPFALQALAAGKHVLCEKPLAVTARQADQIAETSRRSGRRATVNFILRLSPIVTMVQRILRQEILGRPLHACFENYAQDEVLPPSHWFWDRALSGGIFIEHGVHFFDLYRWWFGRGRVAGAWYLTRPGTHQQDRAACTMEFPDMLVTHYHGFDQPIRLDRQRHLILLERGDIVVRGWIPLQMQVHGLVDPGQLDALAAAVPQGTLSVLRHYDEPERRFRSHGRDHFVSAEVRMDYGVRAPKMEVYGELVRGLMEDFARSIRTGGPTLVTLEDAVEAVRTGEAANQLADGR